MSGIARSAHGVFDACFGGQAAAHPGRRLHAALLDAVADPGEPWERRPSLCHDGTPVVYSFKSGGQGGGLRILVEPGARSAPVSRQIPDALDTARTVLTHVEAEGVAELLQEIASAALPASAEDRDRLWGGIWLGAVIGAQRSELRLYVNLRHGTPLQRWQRVADLLAPLAPRALEPDVARWMQCLAPHARPVGLGVAVRGGRLLALRIYAGHAAPTRASLTGSCRLGGEAAYVLEEVVADFEQRFGALRPQGVTTGHDFVLDGVSRIVDFGRCKVDLSCQAVAAQERCALEAWVHGTFDALTAPASAEMKDRRRPTPAEIAVRASSSAPAAWTLERFTAALHTHWGGATTEFLSLGFADQAFSHATVYAKPGSLH